MTGAPSIELEGGACADLLPEVVDKYYFGHSGERFQLAVGRAICANCPIHLACLEEAIIAPPGHGMRGGETNPSLWRLHARWMDEHIESDVLALEAVAHQRASVAAINRHPEYRRGRFVSPALAFPERGGAA